MQRLILAETQGVADTHQRRLTLIAAVERARQVWVQRRDDYFAERVNVDQLLESRKDLSHIESSLLDTRYDVLSRERRLAGATGYVYKVVGLELAGRSRTGADGRRER